MRAVFAVYRDPAFRTAVSLLLVPHMVFFGIQGLWIGRWLSDVARLPDGTVACLLSLSMAGVIAGVGVLLFVLVQAAIVFDWRPSLALLAILFTLVGTAAGLDYAIVAQTVPRSLAGRAATCLNLSIFLGAFLMQAGFGQLVGLWQPDAAGHYAAQAYRVAFGMLVLLQLPGLLNHLANHFLRQRPVECGIALLAQKEEYEIGPLRPPR